MALTAGRKARGERRAARGVTLIEMLVAMAITLIMMGAVISVFGLIGTGVAGNRAIIEMSERMRAVRNRLQLDLEGVTAPMRPPLRPEQGAGYFEYIEGPGRDTDYMPTITGPPPPMYGLVGDWDDILMFTVRSNGEPFSGRVPNGAGGFTTIQSQIAEVIWFVAPTPLVTAVPGTVPSLTLYRRTLLVAPAVGPQQFSAASQSAVDALALNFLYSADVSYSMNRYSAPNPPPSGPTYYYVTLTPNSLGDLTKRENRYLHNTTTGYPFPFQLPCGPAAQRPTNPLSGTYFFATDATPPQWFMYSASNGWQAQPQGGAGFPPPNAITASPRFGDDVVLTNVLSFDVKAFDPGAPVLSSSNGTALVPSDVGYPNGTSTISYGAYVDLNYLYPKPYVNPPLSYFSGPPAPPAVPGAPTPPYGSMLSATPTYDTWSFHYEAAGTYTVISGSNVFIPPAATNGLIDPNPVTGASSGVVDDPSEDYTAPPYPVPLRGIQVKIRCYEPDSRQVREVTIVQDFLPNN